MNYTRRGLSFTEVERPLAPEPDSNSLLAYVNREMARVRSLTADAQIATAEQRHAAARNAMRSIMTICESVVEESTRRG